MKLNLGCGPLPIHPQHYEIMTNPEEWTLVDRFVKDPAITNWDAEKLDEVPAESCDTIYASHLLEHISHRKVGDVLSLWRGKLKENGELILNVPDLAWVAREIIKYENMQPLTSDVYSSFEGERGLQSIVYGTHSHDGEYHKAGFTQTSLTELLQAVGFYDIHVRKYIDAHDMGVLLVRGKKL